MAVDTGIINDHVRDNQAILIDIYAMQMFNFDNTHLVGTRPRWVDVSIGVRLRYRKMATDLLQEVLR